MKLFAPTFFVCVQFLLISTTVNAVPLSPYKLYSNMPDNSQYAPNYDPAPAHGDKWGVMMCGPTSASNSMAWLADNNPAYDKLKKKKVGDEWVEMTSAEMIEELAKKMAPAWDWDSDDYPGVTDDQFVKGKKDYAESRGLTLDIKWIKNKSLGLDWGKETVGEPTLEWIMKEVDEDEDIEISSPEHWITVDVDSGYWLKNWATIGGYMGEKFEDGNNNGFWDDGELFWDENYLGLDIGALGIYDSFLFLNDPADGNDGWQLTEMKDGKLFVGKFGYIETAVSESPIPEPSTILILGLGLLGIAGTKRKVRRKAI